MLIKSGSFTKVANATANATQDITGFSFVPKAILFTSVKSAGADDTLTAGSHLMFGITDFNDSFSAAYSVDNNVTPSSTTHRTTNTGCIVFCNGAGSEEARATIQTISGGFRLTWAVNSNATAWRISYIAWGGVTQAKALAWNATTSGATQDVTGVGFQPKAIINIMSMGTGLASSGRHATIGFGVATGASSEFVSGITSSDAVDPSASAKFNRDNACVALLDHIDGSTYKMVMDLNSFLADGFRLNHATQAATTYKIFTLALGGTNQNFKAGTYTSNTTAGNQSVTGVGFQSLGGLFTSTAMASGTAAQAEAKFSVGVTEGTTPRDGYWTGERDGQSSTDAVNVNNTNDLLRFFTVTGGAPVEGTANMLINPVSMDTDGFTVSVGGINSPPTTPRVNYFLFSGVETTVVGQSRIFVYNRRKLVTLSRIKRYTLTSHTAKTLTTPYTIYIARTRIIGFIYRIIQSAWLTNVHRYHAGGPIGSNRIKRYNVRKTVTRSITHRSHINNKVSRNYIFNYNNRKRITLSRIMHYSLRTLVTLSRVKRYRLGFTIVGRSSIQKYDNIVHPLLFIKKSTNTDLSSTGGDTETVGLLKAIQPNEEASATLGVTWTQTLTWKRLKWVTSTIPGYQTWQGGTYTWRLRITQSPGGNFGSIGDVELREVILRRLSADGATVKASKSSGTLATPPNLDEVGTKTGTIVWDDGTQNPANADKTDRLEVVFRCFYDYVGGSISGNKTIYFGTNQASSKDEVDTPLVQIYTRGNNLTSNYQNKNLVVKSVTHRYSSLHNVTNSRIKMYSMTGKASRNLEFDYHLNLRISKTLTKRYGIGGPVWNTQIHGYTLITSATRSTTHRYASKILAEASMLTSLYDNVGKAILDQSHNWTMSAYTSSESIHPYKIFIPFSKTFSFRYHIRPRKTDVRTTSELYMFPYRPRIYIKTLTGSESIYTYDAFVPENSLIKVISLDFTLTESAASTFELSIEDSNNTIDLRRVGLGNRIIIQVAKFIDDYQNVISGFIRRVRVERPDTGIRIIKLSGYSSQVRSNERVTNFKRAAERERAASNIPRRDDEGMKAANLVKDLWSTVDHLPLGEPLEPFTTEGVNPEVHAFIPSITADHETFASVMDKIATTVGGMWSISPQDDVRLEYPSEIHSGITIKDTQEPEDSAYTTGYIVGSWSYEDSMELSDGFANRLYGRHGAIISSAELSELSNNATPTFEQAIAMQFIPGSPAFKNMALLLSKIGEPTGYLHGEIVMDNGDDSPQGGLPIAFFKIPYNELETQAEQVYRLNLQFYTKRYQVDKKHWIILYAYGSDAQNCARWHHNGDFSTEGVYSASRTPGDEHGSESWRISNHGPAYVYSLFESRAHMTEASDMYSIFKYGLVEAVVDIGWITEDEVADEYLMNILHFSAKPKRIYDINTVQAPDQLLLPGQLINIVDSKSGFTKDPPVMAEILEARYSFNADEYGLGTNFVQIRPVGYLEPFAQIEPVELDIDEPDLPLEGTYLYEPGGIPVWLVILPPERVDIYDSILKYVTHRVPTQTVTLSDSIVRQKRKPRTIAEPSYLVSDSVARRQLLSHKTIIENVLISEGYFVAVKLTGVVVSRSMTESVPVGGTGNFESGNFNSNFRIATGPETLTAVKNP